MRSRDCSCRTYLSGGEGVGGPLLSLDSESEAGECEREEDEEGIIGKAMPEITNLWASRARRSEVEGRRDGVIFSERHRRSGFPTWKGRRGLPSYRQSVPSRREWRWNYF